MNSHKIGIGNATPIKILNVAVNDRRAMSVLKNKGRISLLKDIANSIKHNTDISDADVICLPGGYFFTNKFVGNLLFDERKSVLETEVFHEAIQSFCDILPNATLVIGIDSRPVFTSNHGLYFEIEGRGIKAMRKSSNLFSNNNQVPFKEKGDELCVAYKNGEVIGIGRKVFPVNWDSKQFIPNCTGHKILLCNCYDMFGIMIEFEEKHLQTHSARRSYINTISKDGKLYSKRDGREFHDLRDTAIQNWNNFLKTHKPTIAITTIHQFDEPRGANFWMRHGIATASATLGKIAGKPCIAIGAAHFIYELPNENQAHLCSFGVSKNHIYKGQYRPLLDHKPQYFMEDIGTKWETEFVVKGWEL